MKVCYNASFTFLNNPKDLDPSSKTDLDFWIVLEGKETPSYNRRNKVSGKNSRTDQSFPWLFFCVSFCGFPLNVFHARFSMFSMVP